MGTSLQSYRNPAFDVMKGIAVLLMVWEHAAQHLLPMEHAFIYSFHMPLFFLLAGYFAKDVTSFDGFWGITKKNAKRLLLPYVVTFLLLIVWGATQTILKHDPACVTRYVITLFWVSGDAWNAESGLITAGPTWFLIALFWAREIFHCLQVGANKWFPQHKEISIVISCLLLALGAQFLYPKVEPLPLGILPGVAALSFYSIGWVVRKHSIPRYIIALCIICWPISIYWGGIEMMDCQLKLFPVDILGACGATYIIYQVCNFVCKFNSNYAWLKNSPIFLRWCGQFSLAILCMHTFETHSGLLWSFRCRMPFEVTTDDMAYVRLVAAIAFAFIVINIPYLKKIYR